MKTKVFAIIACIFMLIVAGCATPAGRTVGQVVDDSAITSKITAKIIRHKEFKFLKINVDTFQGNVVLRGNVSSVGLERKLVKIAKGVYGVQSVRSKLKITPGKGKMKKSKGKKW